MASVSVYYRKKGNRWHIRFVQKGRKEIVETYPGTLPEKTIDDRCGWYRQEIALGKLKPWQKKESQDRQKKLSLLLSDARDLYIKDGKFSGRWKTNAAGICKTAVANEWRINCLIEAIGDLPIGEVDAELVIYCINTIDANAYSKKSILSSINTFLKWLHKNGYKNQLIKIDLPKNTKDRAKEIERNVRGITIGELKRLCVAMRIRERQISQNKYAGHWQSRQWAICAFQFVFVLMLRREETDKLYPGDFKGDYSQFTIGNLKEPHRPEFIPKGGIATVPTTKLARQVLRQMDIHKMPKDQPVLKHSPDQIYRKIKEAQVIAFPDKRIRLHDLRHGGVMYLRSKGWPESLVSQLARHSSSEVTAKIYSGIDPTELRRTLRSFDGV